MIDYPDINFPVLHLTNYYLWEGDLEKPEQRDILDILRVYSEYRKVGFDTRTSYTCENPECRATHNIIQPLPMGYQIKCPSCLKVLSFPDGWLLKDKKPAGNIISRFLNKKIYIGIE
jgi:hypothetical protein